MNTPTKSFMVFAALIALPAAASATFPPELKSKLNLAVIPDCTICHTSLIGGLGTVTNPFGQAMMAAGLGAANTAAIKPAADKLVADKTDSDGDGVGDIDELKAGTDPNVGGTKPGTTGPTFGCGGTAAPFGVFPLAFVALLGLGRTRRKHV